MRRINVFLSLAWQIFKLSTPPWQHFLGTMYVKHHLLIHGCGDTRYAALESWEMLWLSTKSQKAIHFVHCVSTRVTDHCGSVSGSICQVQTVTSNTLFTAPFNTWFQHVWQEGKMFHLPLCSCKGWKANGMASQKHLLALVKQADKLTLASTAVTTQISLH